MKLNWFVYALLASVAYGIANIFYKFTECSKLNIKVYVPILLVFNGIIGTLFFIYNKSYLEIPKIKNFKNVLLKIFGISLFIFFGNLFIWSSYKTVYNLGLTRAVFSGSLIILLSIISMLVYKKNLKILQ